MCTMDFSSEFLILIDFGDYHLFQFFLLDITEKCPKFSFTPEFIFKKCLINLNL